MEKFFGRIIISENLHALVSLMKENGIILFSGLLAEDESGIVFETLKLGLAHHNTIQKDRWICMHFFN